MIAHAVATQPSPLGMLVVIAVVLTLFCVAGGVVELLGRWEDTDDREPWTSDDGRTVK